MIDKRKCPYCNNSGWRKCNDCDGKGYKNKINAISISLYGNAVYERITCQKCDGKGSIPCNTCNGVGWILKRQ